MGIPALLGMPIFLSRRYAPVFEVEPGFAGEWPEQSAFLLLPQDFVQGNPVYAQKAGHLLLGNSHIGCEGVATWDYVLCQKFAGTGQHVIKVQ